MTDMDKPGGCRGGTVRGVETGAAPIAFEPFSETIAQLMRAPSGRACARGGDDGDDACHPAAAGLEALRASLARCRRYNAALTRGVVDMAVTARRLGTPGAAVLARSCEAAMTAALRAGTATPGTADAESDADGLEALLGVVVAARALLEAGVVPPGPDPAGRLAAALERATAAAEAILAGAGGGGGGHA